MSRKPGLNSPLVTNIPEAHPSKVAVEETCQDLLYELGPAWFITISAVAGRRKDWDIGIGRRRPGKPPQFRNTAIHRGSQNAAFVRKWLATASAQIKNEPVMTFGMMPLGEVSDAAVSELLDMVGQYGGRVHPDGWITLDDQKAWPKFLDHAARLGVTLVASVR